MNACPFSDAELRLMSEYCFDEGAIVHKYELEAMAEELENRYGEEPEIDLVVRESVAQYRRRMDDELGSLAKYSTAAF